MGSTLLFASERRAVRRALRLPCQVVRDRGFKLVARKVLDLSPDGMLVMADERVLTGDELVVSFRLPRTREWFDTEATVARVIHGRRPKDGGQCFGIEFSSLPEDARRYLRGALRGVPPPLPKRERRIDYAASVHLAALG